MSDSEDKLPLMSKSRLDDDARSLGPPERVGTRSKSPNLSLIKSISEESSLLDVSRSSTLVSRVSSTTSTIDGKIGPNRASKLGYQGLKDFDIPLRTLEESAPGFDGQLHHNRMLVERNYNTIQAHPFGNRFRNFEAPQWRSFGIHLTLCALAYPILLIFVVIARDKDLFVARVLVGAGCGLLGLALGVSLIRLSRPIIEAVG